MFDLEAALHDLGEDVVFPPTPDISDAVMQDVVAQTSNPSTKQRSRLRLIAYAVAAGAIVVMLLSLPGPRAAIADLLGLGAVKLTIVDSLPPAEFVANPSGSESSLADARNSVDFPIATLKTEPTAVFVDRSVPGGMVTLVFHTDDGRPAMTVTQMVGSTDDGLIQKLLGPASQVTVVQTDTGSSYWIEGGPHVVMFLDRNGDLLEDQPRLSGNTLVYVNDDVTVRIEGAITVDQALSLARELIAS